MMREVARIRISMLRDGVTLYDNSRRNYYLQEYESKLQQLDQLIRRTSIRLISGTKSDTSSSEAPEQKKDPC
ncbi:hypothetical protein [Geobacter pickeringii]|uniref:hypothetical protein n=1 Tax=Geobacter pickeringii TaxID=345632 RepID=UPI001F1604C9|nr:hypothetical protein [Geobacter pickeringii]